MTEEKNVKSLEKALDIIEIVSNEQQDASLSEIARKTGLPKSTVHRLIATLTGRGYLEKTKAQLDVILEDCSFIKFTPNTIASREELDAEIAKVRKQGWAMDNEEFEKGHRCIGAPIFDYKGDIIAAVSASGDKRVLTDDRIEEVAEAVMKAASRISHRMGYVE